MSFADRLQRAWYEGHPALALLAENGETKKLEIDMKRSSDNIRSVIKARYYIAVLNCSGSGVTVQDS